MEHQFYNKSAKNKFKQNCSIDIEILPGGGGHTGH